MPTYAYRCTNPECAHTFDLVQAFTDDAVTECPVCGQPVRKVFSPVGVVFKGSGFYRNDSRGKTESSEKVEAKSSSDKGSGDKGSSDSGGSSEKKSEASSASGSSSSGSGSSGSGSSSSGSSDSGGSGSSGSGSASKSGASTPPAKAS